MIVLHIDSSPRGVDSVSRDLTRQIVNRLKVVEPTLDVVQYDLGDRPLPHLSSDAIGALRRAELATAEQRELGALSDRMIDQSHKSVNPTGIVPAGPELDFLSPRRPEFFPARSSQSERRAAV
jgi:FMN-dependent NADH-azoreductase